MTLFGGIKAIKQILKNSEHPATMLWSFGKLTFFRYIHQPKKVNVLGYSIEYADYRLFYEVFISIFIQKDYAFQSDKKSPLIIDCGSNIGLSALFFKKNYPNSKIVCFEPDKEALEILGNNIKNNNLKNVKIVNKAIDLKKGFMTFYTDKDMKASPGMSLYTRFQEQTKSTNKIKVEVTLLSEYITSSVNFLKIDIEGSELGVLEDLKINNKLRLINEMVIEYHHNSNPKNKLSEILRILEENNFDYKISSLIEPPFYKYKEKGYNILVHAKKI